MVRNSDGVMYGKACPGLVTARCAYGVVSVISEWAHLRTYRQFGDFGGSGRRGRGQAEGRE